MPLRYTLVATLSSTGLMGFHCPDSRPLLHCRSSIACTMSQLYCSPGFHLTPSSTATHLH
eukprot:855314-Pelagomonas_calceolata.AAC.6